jgi:integrase
MSTKRRRGHGVYLGKRGSTWRVAYWIDTPKGRRQVQETFKNYDDAKNLKAKLDGGAPRADGRQLVKDFLEDWLRSLANDSGYAPSTVKSYGYKLRRYIITPIGDLPLRRVTTSKLTAVLSDVPKGSVRVVRFALSGAFNAAVEAGEMAENPVRRVALGRKPSKRKPAEVWSQEEIAAFLDAARGDRLEAAWRLLAVTGLREGELLGLPEDGFSEAAGTVLIRQQVTTAGGRMMLLPVKETNSNRTVDVDPRTIALLKKRATAQKEERLAAGALWRGNDGLLFTHPGGGTIHPTTFRDYFHKLVERAEIRPGAPHRMRHSHASALLGAGFGLPYVAERLGHSKQTCLILYGHVQPTSGKAAARAIAGWYGG